MDVGSMCREESKKQTSLSATKDDRDLWGTMIANTLKGMAQKGEENDLYKGISTDMRELTQARTHTGRHRDTRAHTHVLVIIRLY